MPVSNSLCVADNVSRTGKQGNVNSYNRQEISAWLALLTTCAKNKDFHRGASVHADILKSGLFQKYPFVGNAVVSMYAKCGALAKAQEVLEGLPVRNVLSWNMLIVRYAQGVHAKEALNCFERMQGEGLVPDAVTFASILKACGSVRALEKGTEIHSEIITLGLLGEDIVLGNALVDMYVKCGAVKKAKEVLEGLPVRDVVSWSAVITAYAKHQQGKEALFCFEHMQIEGLCPDAVTLACALKACGSTRALDKGGKIHFEIVRQGLLSDIVLGNALLDMYAKCEACIKAKEVFERLPVRDVVSWSTLITAYEQGENDEEALSCLEWMQHEGLLPDEIVLTCILKVCGKIEALEKGLKVHLMIVNWGLLVGNVVLGNALVDMYAKCGDFTNARKMFESLLVKDVVSWNAMISLCVHGNHTQEVLNFFHQMQCEGLSPDAVTYVCALKACGSLGRIDMIEKLHSEIARVGLFVGNVVLGNTLVDAYGKCGAFTKAKEVLETLPVRDVVSWNALIAGYVQGNHGEEALRCYEWMHRDGLSSDVVTLVCILKACASTAELEKGEDIHYEIVRRGLLAGHAQLGGALVDMYAKCGALQKAREMLEGFENRDVVAWCALITGYMQRGHSKEALNCFKLMQHEGLFPDAVTLACMLKACGSMGALEKGKEIHTEIVRQGLLKGNAVLGHALVDMYAKCDALSKAEELLEGLAIQQVVSWNAVIIGYLKGEHGKEALDCYSKLQQKGHFPDSVTFACVLKACATVGAMDRGVKLHSEIISQGLLEEDIVLGNILVDMYAKCGALAKAKEVHDALPVRNPISWNALIAGYAKDEHGMEALCCFEWMQLEGLYPDEITFVCLLNACSHSRLWDEGQKYFFEMSTSYGITPNLEHHACMVNFFGRAGLLKKAVSMTEKTSSFSYLPLWSALLSACQKWGDLKLGRWAFWHTVKVGNTAPCLDFSSGESCEDIESEMKEHWSEVSKINLSMSIMHGKTDRLCFSDKLKHSNAEIDLT